MSENLAAKRLLDLVPAIMQRWDDRVRAEVSSAAGAAEIVLRDSLPQMLEVMAKVLGDQTDPRTAVRDLAYLTIHGKERANQTTYSLEELILEFDILQEVVLEALEPDHLLGTRDRGVIIQYFNEMVRVAAGEFARVQQTLQAYADRLKQTDRSKDEFLAMLGHELRNLSLPRSRSGMLSANSMALITGWRWAVVQPEASLQRGASPSVST